MNLHLDFRKSEIVFNIFLIAIGALLFYQSAITKATIEEPLTAAVYGMIISGLFLVALVTRCAKLIMTKAADKKQELIITRPKLVLFCTAFTVLYTFCIIEVGYYVSTMVFTTLTIMVLRDKEERTAKAWVITTAGCLAFTIFLYFIFQAFKVYLPNALLI